MSLLEKSDRGLAVTTRNVAQKQRCHSETCPYIYISTQETYPRSQRNASVVRVLVAGIYKCDLLLLCIDPLYVPVFSECDGTCHGFRTGGRHRTVHFMWWGYKRSPSEANPKFDATPLRKPTDRVVLVEYTQHKCYLKFVWHFFKVR